MKEGKTYKSTPKKRTKNKSSSKAYNSKKPNQRVVRAVANTDVNIIFGAVINEALTDEIVVTVIATGFEDSTEPLYRSIEGEREPREKKAATTEEDDEELELPSFLRNRDF